jgi:hypothetical protein
MAVDLSQILDSESLQSLPPMAQALLKLDEQDRARKLALANQQGDEIMRSVKANRTNPFDAAITAYAQGNPMNPWGAGAQGAQEANQSNAKLQQTAELKLAELRGKAQESNIIDKLASPLLRTSLGRAGSEGILPNGNKYIKSGTRFYEVIPAKDTPEGYTLKEVVSAEKTIMGADPTAKLAEAQTRQIFETLEKGGAFYGWDDEMIAQWQEATYAEILSHVGALGRSQAGVTPSPRPTVNASPLPGASQPQLQAPRPAPPPSPQDLPTMIKERDSLPIGSQARQAANEALIALKSGKSLPPPPGATMPPAQMPGEAPISLPPPPVTRPVVKTGQSLEEGKKYGSERGGAYAKESAGWTDLYGNAGKLENQLGLLKQLYGSNSDIASGSVAPVFKSLKSGLSGLGLNMGQSSSLEDMIQSLSVNLSLHARTADGQNLLPGSMSNYEDQLLQNMQPGLSTTKEGRMLMIDFMTEIARSNKRMAQAASEYESQKGRLDSGWTKLRERKSKEEMARLAILQRRIMAQHAPR